MINGLRRTIGALRARSWTVVADRTLLDEGAAGERTVAQMRLAVTMVIMLVPLAAVLRDPELPEPRVGLAAAIVSTGVAAALVAFTRRGFYRPWLGVVTSLWDVTLVTAILAVFIAIGNPYLATNTLVVYPVYLVAIAATALRYDPRVSIVAGSAATLQYLLVILVVWLFGPGETAAGRMSNGPFTWGDQFGRVVLLGTMTCLATAIASRSVLLRRMSVFDGLTELHTRGYFEERLAAEMRRAGRYRRDLSVAILDIDGYKDFNDSHGHPAGDAALRVVAGALRRALRSTDVVARYGGDEFVIIFPETHGIDAVQKMESIRAAIAALSIETMRGTMSARLTISAGVASWPGDGAWPDELVYAADDRLLEAKRDGRDRVVGPGATAPANAYPAQPWVRSV